MNENLMAVEITNPQILTPQEKPGPIVLVDKAPQITVLSLCVHNGVKHVIQKSNLNSRFELRLSTLVQKNPMGFFDFPLSAVFGESEPDAITEKKWARFSVVVDSIYEKRRILSSLESYIMSLSSSPSLLADTVTMADEVLTNAIYSAPYMDSQNSNRTSRSYESAHIDPHRKPILFAGHDGERILIGCRDAYGTLNIEKLILRIKKCYEDGICDALKSGEGGAGIGSFLVFNSCASMYIGVNGGKSTTICCSFPLKLSALKRSEIPKNIHLIHC